MHCQQFADVITRTKSTPTLMTRIERAGTIGHLMICCYCRSWMRDNWRRKPSLIERLEESIMFAEDIRDPEFCRIAFPIHERTS